jgi:hypothetical protein
MLPSVALIRKSLQFLPFVFIDPQSILAEHTLSIGLLYLMRRTVNRTHAPVDSERFSNFGLLLRCKLDI